MEDAEAALAEDHLRRVTRDVGGALDRNADIRRMKRWRIVDPVTHESHDVATAFQRENDSILLRRRQAREEASFLGHVVQRCIV
jgi:hypothetical protein